MTQASDSEETRRRILAAARVVFARDGFVDATLAEVAREAGLGKSSLYRHVESKAELFVETLVAQTEDAAPLIAAVAACDDPPEAKLRALAAAQRAFLAEHPDYRQVVWAIDNQDLIGELPRALVDRVRALWQAPLDGLEAIIADGIACGDFRDCDPRVAAHVIWNLGNLVFELRFSHERRRLLGVPLERFQEEALELAIRGLRRAGRLAGEG